MLELAKLPQPPLSDTMNPLPHFLSNEDIKSVNRLSQIIEFDAIKSVEKELIEDLTICIAHLLTGNSFDIIDFFEKQSPEKRKVLINRILSSILSLKNLEDQNKAGYADFMELISLYL